MDLWGLLGVQKLFCWEFKSFCFPQASSLEFVLGWMHLQDAEIPEFHLGMLQRERGCSRGSGAAARAVLGHFSLCRCFVRAVVGRETSGRLSPAEKLLPQTLISQVKPCCCVPPSPPAGRWRRSQGEISLKKQNVALALPCWSGDWSLSGSGLISFFLSFTGS